MAGNSPQPNVVGGDSLHVLSLHFWLLLAITGVGAGVAGALLMLLLHTVQHVLWPYRAGDNFLHAVRHASAIRTVSVVAAAGLLAGVVRFILRVETNGGHGGELAEKIWFGRGALDPLRTLVRIVLSIVVVGMGASLGREAAPKQAGALIASSIAPWGDLSRAQQRLLVACGAGAGIAAVYNVPFGGAIFALEVLLGGLSLSLVPPALAAAMIATAVSWLFLPDQPTYKIPFYPASLSQTMWAVLAGPLMGAVAVLYVRLISAADALRSRRLVVLIAPTVVFTCLGAVALRYPQLLGNGRDAVQLAFLGRFGLPLLVALVFLKPLATAACLGSGAPGGLFTPTLTLGAIFGGLLGHLWLMIWPGAPLGSFTIIGACAVLAAATQGPVSAVVLVLELTWRADTIMVPIILATASAVLIARKLEARSIYSARIHLGRSAAGRAAGEKEAKDFIALSSSARAIETLRATLDGAFDHKPIYVVDEKGGLVGELLPHEVRRWEARALPLETATAADLATAVMPILTSDDEEIITEKFKVAGKAVLPVINTCKRELVGVRHP